MRTSANSAAVGTSGIIKHGEWHERKRPITNCDRIMYRHNLSTIRRPDNLRDYRLVLGIIVKIISLGAGVQSSTMFLMSCMGELPKVDVAIFADTGAEPRAVYNHLMYLRDIGKEYNIPIEVVSAGNLEADLLSDKERVSSLPYFVKNNDGSQGTMMRQCTLDYKIAPLKKRTKSLLKERGEGVAETWIGISLDETQRMKPSRVKYSVHRWPLIELRMSRYDCLNWYKKKAFRSPPRSACVFCPYHNNKEWQRIKDEDMCGWKRAVSIDKKIRNNRKVKGELFLHREMKPLDEIKFDEDYGQIDMFGNECEGLCGI